MAHPLLKEFEQINFDNTRQITIDYAVNQEERIMYVRSRMYDDYHDFYLFWKINLKNNTVIDITGTMDQLPFSDCSKALAITKQIVGLEIGAGVKRRFRERFLKQQGCTHITELALATFDFIMARLIGPEGRNVTGQKRHQLIKQLSVFLCKNNSCAIFNQQNEENFDERGRYKGKDYLF